MKTTIKLSAIVLLAFLAVTACKKKTSVGPQGPTGATGATGNANVTNTTFTVTNWTGDGFTYGSGYLYVPGLDSTVFVSGMVMAYYQSGGAFYPLPHNTGSYTIQPEFGLHFMQLYLFKNDHSFFPDPSGADVIFRVVTIPPAMIKQHPKVNYNNYREVVNTFQLTE